ncbi:YggS family pyridoxal phosphate-dependent enzyme [Reichenbachiella carrageenanivorans]|uniref:Pyridoxal phosphate homeostasis protein n=1 Tax=Reichenbachiella carrageenanivorans TaxID=2979869 RepID=A0ABY6CW84_9BACT|nr:YggS family pyridoxal phosphate-dependent enzyme [Reichenbachiella carrageenanivorans]UXX78128.1 YggS family pyridoxal phosphate-dependent enzyme [Reichenbachiella carrageenanivorans]
MSVKEQLLSIKKELEGTSAQLIAVSKTKPNTLIEEAYSAGQRAFGENKVQELVDKAEALPKDIAWHMIGHLQRNKVKYIAPFVHLIHGVDTLKLLKEINKEGKKNNRIISCLLQIHIAMEDTKFGFSMDEVRELLDSGVLDELPNISIVGLMGMATHTPDETLIRNEFAGLRTFFEALQTSYTHSQLALEEISMGMSGDYKIAVGEGSTMVRIGSSIFGTRNYTV